MSYRSSDPRPTTGTHDEGPVRSLHLIDSLAAGGAEESLVGMLPGLLARGIEPSVLVLHDRSVGLAERVNGLGIPLTELPGQTPFEWARSLRRHLRKHAADVLHTTLYQSDVVGRLGTLGLGVPVLTSLVNVPYDGSRMRDPSVRWTRLYAARAIETLGAHLCRGGFHAITDAVARSASGTLGIRSSRIMVIPRGRDRSRLGYPSTDRRRAARRSLGIAEDARVVLHVGREEYQKGQDLLLEAASSFLSRPDTILLMAGRRGAASPAIDDAMGRLADLPVRRLGHRADVPELLAASDLFVFPSRYEGLGGALLEALAMAVPVVASDLAPVREVLGDVGRYVPPGDADALDLAVREALTEDEAAVRNRTARGLVRFEQRFEQSIVDEAMAALLRRTARSS